MMNKVVFFTESGEKIGLGHVYRCLALAQEFDQNGVKPIFIINAGEDFSSILKPYETFTVDWISNFERVSEFLNSETIAVIDSYLAPMDVYERIREKAKTGVYFDDTKRIAYPKGFIVNGQINASDFDYPEQPGRTYLLGTKYQPVRKEFKETSTRNIKESLESIMITFGGDDARSLTRFVLTLLNEKYPNLRKNVVIGNSFVDKLEDISHEKIVFYRNADAETMKNIMLSSDLAISAAGQTLYELAVSGTPTIAIGVAENQKGNIEGWQQAGFIEFAGWWNEKALENKLFKIIAKMMDRTKRSEKTANVQKIIDGMGSGRILKRIFAGTSEKINRVAILTSKGSSFVPYSDLMFSNLKKRDVKHELFYDHKEIGSEFDIVFILSYFNKIQEKYLLQHKHNLVVHASDLPAGKGWAPLFWQILEGKNQIPIVMFEATSKIDEGDIYIKDFIEFNGTELHDEIRLALAEKTVDMCMRFIDEYKTVEPVKQQGKESFYGKRTPSDSELDIKKSIEEQFNLLRIVNNEEFPAFFRIRGKRYFLKIFAEVENENK